MLAIVAEWTDLHVDGCLSEVGAIRVGDATQLIHCCNERAHEAEVDECDEEGRSTG